MRQPFYSVVLNNNAKTNLTDRIDSFVFEECVDQDDMLEITFSPLDLNQINFDEDLITGATVTFMWGYLGESNSGYRTARITDIEVSYEQKITMRIRALDMGTVMKKTSDNKVWQNVTSGQIVREIAARYNLTAIVEAEGRTWTNLAQANKSDFQLLKQIAQEDGSGDFIAYVNNTELRFVKRNLLNASSRTFSYGDPNSGILSFQPRVQESTANVAGIKANTAAVDPATGQLINGESTRNQGDMLGQFVNVYDANAEKIGVRRVNTGKTIVVPAADDSAANKAKQQTKLGALNAETATLITEGDVNLRATGVITMQGVLKRHRGNWWVNKVRHNINQSGYLTTIELAKNASKTGSVTPTGAVNNTIGAESSQPRTRKIVVYDANAERIVR